jgi:predicted Zn-ribbon and HTH transcriptional regulator
MQEQLPRLNLSNQPVLCKKCGKEFRGEEMNQHSPETGHEEFYLKPV